MKPSGRLASAPGGEPRAWKGLRAFVAVVALVVLLVSGAAAGDSAFPYDRGGVGLPQARFAARILEQGLRERDIVRPPDPEQVQELFREARKGGLDQSRVAGSLFPGSAAVLALLSAERDVDNFESDAEHSGRAGEFYRGETLLVRHVQPLFRSYVELFTTAYDELGGPFAMAASGPAFAKRMRNGILPYAPGLGIAPPPRYQLADAHPYALDLFFSRIERLSDGQEGPPIPSLSGGIVVASARNWRGGAGIESWRGGGLSPSAGNGVVVYDPVSRRFFSYFHMRTTDRRPGDIVRPGDVLGIGGNTGMNARRPGHGGHVHVEIFDAAADRSLDSYRILDLVRGR
ncbi:MAG TPA: M23 family metallopeptidase [Rectinemataceae bacterium]|nr:M23 family metallopeptidase [Rectinemataceae bacterium]